MNPELQNQAGFVKSSEAWPGFWFEGKKNVYQNFEKAEKFFTIAGDILQSRSRGAVMVVCSRIQRVRLEIETPI